MQITETRTVIFLECDNRLMREKEGDFGLPSAVVKTGDHPEEVLIQKLAHLQLKESDLNSLGQQLISVGGKEYQTYFFKAKLPRLSNQDQYEWISIFSLKLIKQYSVIKEKFEETYKERIWQSVPSSSELVFKKGKKKLVFGPERRFVVSLMGGPGSGKTTQAGFLSRVYGISKVAKREIIASEFTQSSDLSQMIVNFSAKREGQLLPLEIDYGILTKRLIQRDCETGFLLVDFPLHQTDCQVVSDIFLKKQDFYLPLLLEVDEKTGVERVNRDKLSAVRLDLFKQHQQKAIEALKQRKAVHVVPCGDIVSTFDVISLYVQTQLDQFYEEQRLEKEEKQKKKTLEGQVKDLSTTVEQLQTEVKKLKSENQTLRTPSLTRSERQPLIEPENESCGCVIS